MSVFSKGILLWPRCAPRTSARTSFPSPFEQLRVQFINPQSKSHWISQSGAFQQQRSFSSIPLRASKKPRLATPKKPISQAIAQSKAVTPPTKTIQPVTAPKYESYATILSNKTGTTLLYDAPSHTAYKVACYSGGVFCLLYACFSFWSNYMQAPPDIATWVPYAFSVVSFMMAMFGSWLFLGPASLIRTITAVPTKLGTIQKAIGKQAAGQSNLFLEIELRKMFPVPFWPARKIYIQPSEITLDAPLLARQTPAQAAKERAEDLKAIRHKPMSDYDRRHILTLPFRQMSKNFFNLFQAVGRAWHRAGFVKFRLPSKKKVLKLDIQGGWALDRGRALDRLITIKHS